MHDSFQQCIRQQLEEIRAAETCKNRRIRLAANGKTRTRTQVLAVHSHKHLRSAIQNFWEIKCEFEN